MELTEKDHTALREFKKSKNHNLRTFNRATTLLFLDKGLTVTEIEKLLEVDRTTIWRIRKMYMEYGLVAALKEGGRMGQPLKYTTSHETALTALACGPAPAGRKRWTIRLLATELNRQKGFETFTYSSVRKLLKKTS